MSKKLVEEGVAAWINTQPAGSHFVLESLALFGQIENETKHLPSFFWRDFKSCSMQT